MNSISITNDNLPADHPGWLKAVSRFIAVVFHPLFVPVYLAIYIIYGFPYTFAVLDEKQKLLRLVSIFIITTFFPAVTVFLLWRLNFAASIYLRTQKERIIPYVASIIYFFWAFYVSKNLPGSSPYLTFLFLGIFLSTSAALMANNYFKISMHALAASGGATFIILVALSTTEPMGIAIAISTLLAGLICTTRLIVSDHTQHEVYWGVFIGAIAQLIASWFFL